MDAETIRHFLFKRLMVEVLTGTVQKCDSVHLYPELCAKGDCHTIVHDITCKALVDCIQDAGGVVIQQFNPNMLPSDRAHDLAPDLDVTNANIRSLVDVGITSVLALDNIVSAQCTPLSAASRYERAKVSKYNDLAREANANVIPAIMETGSGAMGLGLQSILDKGNETVSPAWYHKTEAIRTFTTRTFKQFHTQAIAVAYWGGSLQKLKAHDKAHRAELVPSATALLHDLGIAESMGRPHTTPGHRGAGPQRHQTRGGYGGGRGRWHPLF